MVRRDAPIIEHGSKKLNELLNKFVDNITSNVGSQKVKDNSGAPRSKLKIADFDDHDLQSCNTTKQRDGRHHNELKLARICLLGNYINCMQDGITVTVKMTDLPASNGNTTDDKLRNR
eukprot:scaffold23226_cov65-Cyclotella_meneghiniana.AAC.2